MTLHSVDQFPSSWTQAAARFLRSLSCKKAGNFKITWANGVVHPWREYYSGEKQLYPYFPEHQALEVRKSQENRSADDTCRKSFLPYRMVFQRHIGNVNWDRSPIPKRTRQPRAASTSNQSGSWTREAKGACRNQWVDEASEMVMAALTHVAFSAKVGIGQHRKHIVKRILPAVLHCEAIGNHVAETPYPWSSCVAGSEFQLCIGRNASPRQPLCH